MASKHIINEPRELVNDSLAGLVRSNNTVTVDSPSRVIYRTKIEQNQVAIISGGGSGHEPAHAGFVGQGFLSAAVCGNVFASPNVGQIRRAIELTDNKKGILLVVKRYTGDVLLFGLAKEQHAVTNPDKPIRMVVVGEDCAVTRSQGKLVGRRGLAGTVLVYKIAAALAEKGGSVDKVHELAEFVSERVGSMGSGLAHCHVPGTAVGEDHLKGDDEVELGMGIHNETGVKKGTFKNSKDLISQMLPYILNTNDKERAFLPFKHDGKDEVVLLVNNLGGVSSLEMGSIANDTVLLLQEEKIVVRRLIVGTVMTSLNMPGFSLTTLLLPRSGEKFSSEEILGYLDSPSSVPGWPYASTSEPGVPPENQKPKEAEAVKSAGAALPYNAALFEQSIIAAAEGVIKAEPDITKYDTIAGDGDCGLTLKSGAQSVIKAFKDEKVDKKDVVTAILNIAQPVEKSMDGTSGALYSIWLNALAAGTAKSFATSDSDPKKWADALKHALNVLFTYTAARKPSRTLVDPLEAFTNTFSDTLDFGKAVQAAVDACEETKHINAKAGRAAYVGQDTLKNANIPDPGAYGVSVLLQGIQSVLAK